MKYQPSQQNRQDFRDVLISWINQTPFTHSITLTYKTGFYDRDNFRWVERDLSEIQHSTRIFLDRISNPFFSGCQKRKGHKLYSMVIYEGEMKPHSVVNLHSHMAINFPDHDKSGKVVDYPYIMNLIDEVTTRVKFLDVEYNLQEIYNQKGWINYCSKHLIKSDFSIDRLDLRNSHFLS